MVTPKKDKRTTAEWLFLLLFYPAVLMFYVIYKYPHWVLPEGADLKTFHLVGKSPGFWYSTLYTLIVCGIALWVLIANKNRYQRSKKKSPLSKYQRAKFTSILFVQLIGFYFVPYILPALNQDGGFFNDPGKLGAKSAHVYVYPAFQSWGVGIYLFIVIPVAVWFFGKRYCSWFCSCGNLSETIGVLPWGSKWVRLHTPRGKTAQKLEVIQIYVLCFSVIFGLLLFFDGIALFSSKNLISVVQSTQDLIIDFFFGAIVGIGAYPILGTRIWCRYGCPLAQGMKLFGKFSKSRFAVQPNQNCKGLGLCTQACPMGIDVASYAHIEKKPIEVKFGLSETPCIGCGGCIDVCPVDALQFVPIKGNQLAIISSEAESQSFTDLESA